jgi:D-alanyl-D-alanine carboxypeptidase
LKNRGLNRLWPEKKWFLLLLVLVFISLAGCQQDWDPPEASKPEQQPEESPEQQLEEGAASREPEGEEAGQAEEQQVDEDRGSAEDEGHQGKDVPTGGSGEPPSDEEVPDFTSPDSILVLVNKEHPLPADYEPNDLVEPQVPFSFDEKVQKRLMRKEAARALEELFEASEKEGLSLYAVSGYRSYERQEAIFAYNASLHGEEKANQFSARPGESEHQTGLAMDVSSPAVQFDLIEAFADTPEGRWLEENAARFGFIIRYPKDKTHITQYQYEPWHLRYVGKEAAQEMAAKHLTLEEHFDQFNNQD